jgi:hypothetical protein
MISNPTIDIFSVSEWEKETEKEWQEYKKRRYEKFVKESREDGKQFLLNNHFERLKFNNYKDEQTYNFAKKLREEIFTEIYTDIYTFDISETNNDPNDDVEERDDGIIRTDMAEFLIEEDEYEKQPQKELQPGDFLIDESEDDYEPNNESVDENMLTIINGIKNTKL